MTYKILYADPPWSYNDKANAGQRGASHKYPTMSLEDIKALPVQNIADKDSVCLMWATMPLLPEAFETMKAWGYKFKTVAFVWVKTNSPARIVKRMNESTARLWSYEDRTADPEDEFYSMTDDLVFKGMGHYTRGNAELVLLGTKGKTLERLDKSVSQIVIAPRGRHSEKPDEVRQRIVRMYGDIPRVELFARQKFDGWSAWGNEVEPDVILE